MQEFQMRGPWMTLEALLKASDLAGLGSVARAVIADGAVRVNGEVEQRRGRKLRVGDVVLVADQQTTIVAA